MRAGSAPPRGDQTTAHTPSQVGIMLFLKAKFYDWPNLDSKSEFFSHPIKRQDPLGISIIAASQILPVAV